LDGKPEFKSTQNFVVEAAKSADACQPHQPQRFHIGQHVEKYVKKYIGGKRIPPEKSAMTVADVFSCALRGARSCPNYFLIPHQYKAGRKGPFIAVAGAFCSLARPLHKPDRSSCKPIKGQPAKSSFKPQIGEPTCRPSELFVT
jgi:hypothetical protein